MGLTSSDLLQLYGLGVLAGDHHSSLPRAPRHGHVSWLETIVGGARYGPIEPDMDGLRVEPEFCFHIRGHQDSEVYPWVYVHKSYFLLGFMGVPQHHIVIECLDILALGDNLNVLTEGIQNFDPIFEMIIRRELGKPAFLLRVWEDNPSWHRSRSFDRRWVRLDRLG